MGLAARCDGAERGIRGTGMGSGLFPRQCHTQAGPSTGLSLQTYPLRLRSRERTNKGRISSGWDEPPQDAPARAEHPQNHCWECLGLTLTLFLLLFGPVHRHPRESPSIHEPHPPAQPQEGLQPQLRVPVSAAGAPPCSGGGFGITLPTSLCLPGSARAARGSGRCCSSTGPTTWMST